ncbi:Helix-turn-helix [Propionispira arboris]|uniref:Helix-turn-helix n=1 Tax=Propionispira arboris TaxID=84035 RepID=A0A1H6VIY4_9FIRM|nr:helix-turn-helix transcriptional regulator [Propionispira arboris]SEJ00195.1 Helix-turn-helix [Propionispira arboris]
MFKKEIFCQRLRQLRQDKKMTTTQLATEFEVTKQTVSRWELGDRIPTLDTVAAIADYFDVSLDYLVGISDIKKRR